jgi:selenocysteine-specific elongation factor
MRHIVVGTAGHIDHGKSSLVLALTGTDPDRLKEEKARGITIDLGFAHWEAPDLRVAFVDVPGHERFVKNMLAGAGGVDAVILVVAADESVMPQTREHFDICRLLQVKSGFVVLTKADLVDADMLELVRLEVRELVRGSFLENAPILAASSRTGAGLDDVRAAIVALGGTVQGRSVDGAPRLPIDRVFSVKGFGTVVTGTLVSGRLTADADVVVLPGERRLKVRGLQVHGVSERDATAGQRVAVNISGADVGDLTRGDVMASSGSIAATRVADVRIEMLASAKALRHGGRVRFHQGTTEVLGRVAVSHVLGPAGDAAAAAEVPAGATAYARLRLEHPAVLTRGDRFILRAYSPPFTIAGGVVVDPQPPRGGIRTAAGRTRFAPLDPTNPGPVSENDVVAIVSLVDEAGLKGVPLASLVSRAGLTDRRARAVVDVLGASARATVVAECLVSRRALDGASATLVGLLTQHHKASPLDDGLPREEARERVCAHAAPGVFERVVDDLVAAARIVARERLALASHRLALSPEEADAKARLEGAYLAGAFAPPSVTDAASSLGIAMVVAEKMVALLVRQRVLVRVDTLLFHADVLTRLKAELAAWKTAAGGGTVTLDVGTFKERYGVTRKYAIPLLEHLDRERVTRRVGDARVLI